MTQDHLIRSNEMLKIASKGILYEGISLFNVDGRYVFAMGGFEDRVACYLTKGNLRFAFEISSEPNFESYQDAVRNAQTLFTENLQ